MIAGLIRLITGVQARWTGVDPVRPDGSLPVRIYFANHTSHLDAPVIWAALPAALRRKTRPVAAKDYWQRGPIRRRLALKVFRAVLIDRTNVSAHQNPLTAMEEALEAGDSLILFPEGTRGEHTDGEMGLFKPGLWHLARKHPSVELVPVHLENLSRILPKGELIMIPLLATAIFGPTVRIEESEEKPEFLERARSCVAALAKRAVAQ